MFIPIGTDSPLRTTPYMNWALIALTVAVFIAQLVSGDSFGSAHDPGEQPRVMAAWIEACMLDGTTPRLFQFITYGFLHGGLLHLLGNMLFLYIFGNNVNDKMGHVGYLFFYLASVAFAGMGFVLFNRQMPVIGASGGVAAITGAYLVLFPRNHVRIFYFWLLIGVLEVPSFLFVLAFFLKDLLGLSGVSQVAHSAHIAGTLFGVAVSAALLWVRLLPRDAFDIVSFFKQWNRRRQYRDMVNRGWNPFGNTTAKPVRQTPRGWFREEAASEPPPPDPATQQVLELRAEIAEAIAHHRLAEAASLYLKLRARDATQVLGRQNQLDIANQLAAEQRYADAAEAYELFLKNYPKYEQTEQVELMLGIVLNRYLNQPGRAKPYLLRAEAKLLDEHSQKLVRQELERVEKSLAGNV